MAAVFEGWDDRMLAAMRAEIGSMQANDSAERERLLIVWSETEHMIHRLGDRIIGAGRVLEAVDAEINARAGERKEAAE